MDPPVVCSLLPVHPPKIHAVFFIRMVENIEIAFHVPGRQNIQLYPLLAGRIDAVGCCHFGIHIFMGTYTLRWMQIHRGMEISIFQFLQKCPVIRKQLPIPAIARPTVGEPHILVFQFLRDLLIRIRHDFDQYINLRPVRLLKGADCPLKDVKIEDVNMTFIRENTEGEYSGQGAWLYKGQPGEVVIQDSVFSRKGTERVIRYAYELAKKEGKTLTSISKGNALNYSMVFWDKIFKEVGEEYPDVETHTLLVDAASMFMVKDPRRLQVVVTSNLFGDILTDLGAAISGGMGLAAGANLNPERTFPSMFEPIHGSAPDIAGKGIANPLASIWAASQLLDFFGHEDWGKKIIDTIEEMLVNKDTLTRDQGGTASCEECGKRVTELLD